MKKFLLGFLGLGLLALALSVNAEKSGGQNLRQFRLGEHLFGPQASAAGMRGKAVMLDCWGIHCPPCLAMMPEVENLSKEYANRLVMVGVHAQENDKPAIEAVVKKNNLTYSIVNGVTSPVPFSQLPHVFLFDATGELVFTGSPFDKEFKPSLRKAVNSVTANAAATPSGLDALKKLAPPTPGSPAGLPAAGGLAPAQ